MKSDVILRPLLYPPFIGMLQSLFTPHRHRHRCRVSKAWRMGDTEELSDDLFDAHASDSDASCERDRKSPSQCATLSSLPVIATNGRDQTSECGYGRCDVGRTKGIATVIFE